MADSSCQKGYNDTELEERRCDYLNNSAIIENLITSFDGTVAKRKIANVYLSLITDIFN